MTARAIKSDRDANIVKVAYDVANQLYGDPTVSMEDLVHHLGLARRTIERSLQAQMTSWKAILTEVRCAEARKLLVRTQMSASSIAGEVGYLSSTSFTRNYKRIYGETPMKTRKEARRGAR